jgi:TolB-like protein
MIRRTFAILALLVALPAFAAAQQDTRPGIAVFELKNGGSIGPEKEDLSALGVGLQQMIMSELSMNTSLRVVERSFIRQILEEQGLTEAGRVDVQTAARVGRLVGAKYSVLGGFTDINKEMRIDVRIVDTETSEVVKGESVRRNRDDLYDMLVEVAARLTKDVKLPPLAAEVRESREKRNIPREALTMFARAQVYTDQNRVDDAAELYSQIAERFPDMTEAKEALKQLKRS